MDGFAKLFGAGPDQVVAIRREGDDGPEIRLYYRPGAAWTDVCETGLGFKSAAKADRAFAALAEHDCRRHLEAVRADLARMTTDSPEG